VTFAALNLVPAAVGETPAVGAARLALGLAAGAAVVLVPERLWPHRPPVPAGARAGGT
jgi:hypothetical protein